MECAERASGRTQWNLEGFLGHTEHFTSVIQAGQGCPGSLLLRLGQHPGNKPARWLPGPSTVSRPSVQG